MADEHQSEAEGGLEILEEVEDLGAHGHVQGTGRLVGHNDVGVQCQGAGDGHALTLATRDLPGQNVQSAGGQPDQMKEILDFCLALLGGADAVNIERVDQGVVHDHARIQRRGRVLEDDRDRAPQGSAIRSATPQLASFEVDLAARQGLQTHHDAGGGRLTAAGLPHQPEGFAALDAQRDVVDGVNRIWAEEFARTGPVDHVRVSQLDDRVRLGVPGAEGIGGHQWLSFSRTASSSGVMA